MSPELREFCFYCVFFIAFGSAFLMAFRGLGRLQKWNAGRRRPVAADGTVNPAVARWEGETKVLLVHLLLGLVKWPVFLIGAMYVVMGLLAGYYLAPGLFR